MLFACRNAGLQPCTQSRHTLVRQHIDLVVRVHEWFCTLRSSSIRQHIRYMLKQQIRALQADISLVGRWRQATPSVITFQAHVNKVIARQPCYFAAAYPLRVGLGSGSYRSPVRPLVQRWVRHFAVLPRSDLFVDTHNAGSCFLRCNLWVQNCCSYLVGASISLSLICQETHWFAAL
jgi:hypothetical protein